MSEKTHTGNGRRCIECQAIRLHSDSKGKTLRLDITFDATCGLRKEASRIVATLAYAAALEGRDITLTAERGFGKGSLGVPKKVQGDATGNTAALREALKAIAGKAAKVDNIGMGYNDAVNISLDICDIARAALAAPPRNCDRFGSAKEALSMWTKVSGTVRFEDWLFDAAKGGAE